MKIVSYYPWVGPTDPKDVDPRYMIPVMIVSSATYQRASAGCSGAEWTELELARISKDIMLQRTR